MSVMLVIKFDSGVVYSKAYIGYRCRDTAGQERFRTFTKQFLRGAQVIYSNRSN